MFTNVNIDDCRLHVPGRAKQDYASADIWSEFNNILDNIDEEKEKEALCHHLETGDLNSDGRTTAADVAKVVECALKQ